MTCAIVWFRRDLRVADNGALSAALEEADQIVPVFVIDDALWNAAGANRRWYLHGSLAALDGQFDGGLVIRRGAPADALRSLAADVGADAVFIASDHGVYGRQRDRAVAGALEADGRRLVVADCPYAVAPDQITTQSGTPYKVFTPYFRRWLDAAIDDPRSAPSDLRLVPGVESDALPDRPSISADLPDPGEAAAMERLAQFLSDDIENYHEARDHPALDQTSHLSVDLKFGTLHPRQILSRLDRRKSGHDAFARQVAWRDFYGAVLDHWPSSAWEPWNEAVGEIEVDRGDDAGDRFAAWCEGRTGFPIVDAGMRQLLARGWMHNRLRMITASFLVKDLHLDWRWGARYFMEHLVDGDLASNNHGWQWVAGTGTDAAPYFRVLNPTRQSERFDPDGSFIRQWVPEVAAVADDLIHEPWRADPAPPDYPAPLVDHGEEREEALRRYHAATD